VVPRDVLTRTTSLAEGEIRLIRESLQLGADFIQGIEFDGPVLETLRQMQERYDGTGPLGLKGDDILITARIIAATNAFVGMASPRSHRTAMASAHAIKSLLHDIDTRFDRRVAVALADYIENRKGEDALRNLAAKSFRTAR
jgi:HD-GYP domain-containing protein (c-di-GMP phosphodiesterase class II)